MLVSMLARPGPSAVDVAVPGAAERSAKADTETSGLTAVPNTHVPHGGVPPSGEVTVQAQRPGRIPQTVRYVSGADQSWYLRIVP